MSKKVKITWQVDDGYAGGSRPQYCYVDIEDYNDCETEKDKESIIEQAVQESMEQMGYYITNIEIPD